ncbi:MAG: Si-specific NAD(P)(+) transhydrogenase [Spirochaetales bacterium]
MKHYDLIVIGGGPAGEKAAVKAGTHGKSVALVERYSEPGGSTVHNGTLPSKALKETALFLSGKGDAGVYGVDRKLTKEFTVDDFYYRKNEVTKSEVNTINDNLRNHGVDFYQGRGGFVDEHTVQVYGKDIEDPIHISADYLLIATGSYPFHPAHIPFDGKRVHDSNTILKLTRFPRSLVVIGAGVIGCEYTTIFQTIGTHVTLLEGRDNILPFLDGELTKDLIRQMRASGVDIQFNTTVEGVEVPESADQNLKVKLAGGKVIETDMLLYAAGRSGRTDALFLSAIGLEKNARGLIEVNSTYQTRIPHIYAVGDVIGFPSLASTSMDQGRVAVTQMFQLEGYDKIARVFPYGIYTIPEVSMVGMTEEEATKKGIDYGTGKALIANMPRGKIMGCTEGFMKVLYEKATQKVLGVHVIGNLASELIHYGVAAINFGDTLSDLSSAVYNCPSLHELYKYAAYDALENAKGVLVKE